MQASKRLQPLFPIERFPAMAQFVDDQYEMLIPNTLTAKDIYKHLKAAKDTAEAHPRVQGAGTSWLRGG